MLFYTSFLYTQAFFFKFDIVLHVSFFLLLLSVQLVFLSSKPKIIDKVNVKKVFFYVFF